MVEELPYYELVNKAAGAKLEPVDIERSILRSWKREWTVEPESCLFNYEEEMEFHPDLPKRKVSGWTQHMLRYQKLNFPTLLIDPWFVDKWEAFEKFRIRDGKKIINFIGSKNSAKSNFMSMFCLLMVSVDPSYTRAFVSGPYKSAADATIWGRLGTRYNQMKSHQPKMWHNCQEKKSEQRFVFDHASSEAGYIELVTLDKVGKLQGAKSLDPDRGWLILICDEIAEFPSKALMDALDNLTGNQNFICLTGCNFKNIEGLDGDLCRPDGREYGELDLEIDHDWASAYRSHTVRFDGHRSPNVIAKKVIYPYLLREDIRADMEYIHGATGPKYLEQIRSFPNSSMSDFFVTTREKIRSSGGFDEFVWEGGGRTVIGFCDPGFGGDPCKIGAFQFGRARYQGVDGQWHTLNVIEPVNPIETIKIDLKLESSEEWRNRVMAVAGNNLFLKHNALVSPEQQIAVNCGEFCKRHGIEKSNFGYDGSMRASIVHEMTAILGSMIHSIDFGGKATDRIVNTEGKIAHDMYSNFVTEMYFFFSSVVTSGQLRGADKIPAGIAQLCRRPWTNTGSKKQIMPKSEYKLENQGRSPDDADVIVGALEVAQRSGFTGNLRRSTRPSAVSPVAFMDEIGKLPMFLRASAKTLH